MSAEENKAMLRRYLEAMNTANMDVMDELFAPELAGQAKQGFIAYHSAFPDWHEEIVDLVAEEDKVVGRFKCSGTHQGELMGIPPTGRRQEVDEVYFLRVEDGKFVEFWGLEDNLTRMRQLGLLPPRPGVSAEEEKNKAVVRRYFEARVKGDVDAMDETMTPDFVSHAKLLPGQGPDREAQKWAVAKFYGAVSNASVHFEDQIVQGDKVVTRLIVHATHDRGELMGVAPTGKELTFMPIAIHRIEGGKIAEQWGGGTGLSELRGLRLEQEERERERVEQELLVARRIQQASLPKEVPQLEGWHISPYYRPAREVGGDFYDFHLLSGGRLGVVVGDATGKGVPAALVMSTTCGMLQLAAEALESSSPGKVLERVNETLLARIPPNMFVTCFYAILEPKSGTFTYANAGHDLPYLWHGGDAEELRARGMPLGLMPGMSYEEKVIVLERGDSALLYSDGLVEAHDPKGEMFGFPRLRELVAEHGEEPSLGNFLLEKLYSFTGEGWEQEDDITLLTLRRSAARS